MKAVVVDIQGKYAAVLDESGSIHRISNSGYTLGQEIVWDAKQTKRPGMWRRLGTAAAAAALMLGIGTGTAYALPCGTVRLEGDAAITYTVNCFDRVLDVQAQDEQGEALLAQLDTDSLRHKSIQQAVSATLEQLETEGLVEEKVEVTSDTFSSRQQQRIQQKLEQDIQAHMEQKPEQEPEEKEVPAQNETSEIQPEPIPEIPERDLPQDAKPQDAPDAQPSPEEEDNAPSAPENQSDHMTVAPAMELPQDRAEQRPEDQPQTSGENFEKEMRTDPGF